MAKCTRSAVDHFLLCTTSHSIVETIDTRVEGGWRVEVCFDLRKQRGEKGGRRGKKATKATSAHVQLHAKRAVVVDSAVSPLDVAAE